MCIRDSCDIDPVELCFPQIKTARTAEDAYVWTVSYTHLAVYKRQLMYNPTIYETADVISTYVYRRGLLDADYSFSTAVGMFQSVIGLSLIHICTGGRTSGGR